MKTLIIGRAPEAHIMLHDVQCSRRQAFLRLHPSGKIEIVDLSTNGTFVNGMPVPKNTPYPIKRKDSVSFAHTENLNWDEVPNPYKWVKLVSIFAPLAVVLIVLAIIFVPKLIDSNSSAVDTLPVVENGGTITSTDTTKTKDNGSSKTAKSFGLTPPPPPPVKTPANPAPKKVASVKPAPAKAAPTKAAPTKPAPAKAAPTKPAQQKTTPAQQEQSAPAQPKRVL